LTAVRVVRHWVPATPGAWATAGTSHQESGTGSSLTTMLPVRWQEAESTVTVMTHWQVPAAP
jgi:hypothetical protein